MNVCSSYEFLTHSMSLISFDTPLKTSENLWFCDVFRGYQKISVGWNGLRTWLKAPQSYTQLTVRGNSSQLFHKIAALKNLGKFREKRLQCSPCLVKFLAYNVIKKGLYRRSVSLNLWNVTDHFFKERLWTTASE